MIQASGVTKAYANLKVLRGIDLQIEKGEMLAITGASGAGKTTLLQILGTLDYMDSGSLKIGGVEVNKLSERKLAEFRNQQIGFIFQFHQLLPEFNALENVCLPAWLKKEDEKTAQLKGEALLDQLGLLPRAKHKPSELSGGEQQRVAVARALINSPSVVFADEPSGNLDSNNANELHNLFIRLKNELKQTFVVVTHNESFAGMADRVIRIKDGIID